MKETRNFNIALNREDKIISLGGPGVTVASPPGMLDIVSCIKNLKDGDVLRIVGAKLEPCLFKADMSNGPEIKFCEIDAPERKLYPVVCGDHVKVVHLFSYETGTEPYAGEVLEFDVEGPTFITASIGSLFGTAKNRPLAPRSRIPNCHRFNYSINGEVQDDCLILHRDNGYMKLSNVNSAINLATPKYLVLSEDGATVIVDIASSTIKVPESSVGIHESIRITVVDDKTILVGDNRIPTFSELQNIILHLSLCPDTGATINGERASEYKFLSSDKRISLYRFPITSNSVPLFDIELGSPVIMDEPVDNLEDEEDALITVVINTFPEPTVVVSDAYELNGTYDFTEFYIAVYSQSPYQMNIIGLGIVTKHYGKNVYLTDDGNFIEFTKNGEVKYGKIIG